MVLPALAAAQSIQDIPTVGRTGAPRFSTSFTERGPWLPPYGTRERDLWLRRYDRHEQNGLWRSARSGVVKKGGSTPNEVKAERKIYAPLSPYYGRYGYGRNPDDAQIFQSMLQNAQLGEGWLSWFSRTWRAFLSQDNGAWTYITGPGDPSGPLIGAVTGIEALDPMRCYATGNPEFPVLYYSLISNKLHKVHWTRTQRFVDSPDIEEAMYGHGECALSRAIASSLREIRMASYIDMWLDDKPKPGIHLWGGTSETQYEVKVKQFLDRRNTDAGQPLGNVLNIFGLDPAVPVKMDSVNFVEPPEKFDFIQYTTLDVKHIAAALGIDQQEFWELTGGNIGSGTQSEILHQKSRGKLIGLMLAETTRFINTAVLPEYMEFSFRFRDDERDASEAELNASYMDTAAKMKAMSGIFNDAQIRYFLMSSSERIGEALSQEELQTPASDEDVNPTPAAPAIASDTQTQATLGQVVPTASAVPPTPTLKQKNFDSTRSQFVNNVVDLVRGGNNDEMSRRRFGIVFRAQLRTLGQQAFSDGLRAGGVEGDLDEEDLSQVRKWLADQSAYVSDFSEGLYKDGLTPEQIGQHAEMWANKSLESIYQEGLISADKNGMYEWTLGQTEHCPTCLRLAGQRHRFKSWYSAGWLPKSDKLECGGFNCECRLKRTTNSAVGRF